MWKKFRRIFEPAERFFMRLRKKGFNVNKLHSGKNSYLSMLMIGRRLLIFLCQTLQFITRTRRIENRKQSSCPKGHFDIFESAENEREKEKTEKNSVRAINRFSPVVALLSESQLNVTNVYTNLYHTHTCT